MSDRNSADGVSPRASATIFSATCSASLMRIRKTTDSLSTRYSVPTRKHLVKPAHAGMLWPMPGAFGVYLSDLQACQLSLQQLFEAVCSANVGASAPGFTVPAAGVGAQDISLGLFEQEIPWYKTLDDAGALAATPEFVLLSVAKRTMLVSAQYVPQNATGLTAVVTNYAQMIFQARTITSGLAINGFGTSPYALGTTNTLPTANGGTGNFSQWNAVPLNVNQFDPNNTCIPPNGSLTFQIAKVGAGIIVPGGTLTARVRYV